MDTGGLLIGLVFGSIGVGYCLYGKKQQNSLVFWLGVALIGLPYIIDSHMLLIVISILLMTLPLYPNLK